MWLKVMLGMYIPGNEIQLLVFFSQVSPQIYPTTLVVATNTISLIPINDIGSAVCGPIIRHGSSDNRGKHRGFALPAHRCKWGSQILVDVDRCKKVPNFVIPCHRHQDVSPIQILLYFKRADKIAELLRLKIHIVKVFINLTKLNRLFQKRKQKKQKSI